MKVRPAGCDGEGPRWRGVAQSARLPALEPGLTPRACLHFFVLDFQMA